MPDPAAGPVRCATCERTPDPDEPATADGIPWTWSRDAEGRAASTLCAGCAREHARGIEAKLDPEWW